MNNRLALTCLLLIVFLLSGCNQDSTKEESQIAIETKKSEIVFPNEFYGEWLNKTYIDKLKQTKSTKISQEYSDLCKVKIEKQGDSIIMSTTWNFHEGGGITRLIMLEENMATSKSKYEWTDKYFIKLNENKTINISYGEKSADYIKFGKGTNYSSSNEIINETLFSDKYILNDSISIKFFNNGKITGLNDYIFYNVNIDYIDAGMDYDKIYMTKKNEEKTTFGYEFHDKYLEIYRLGCSQFDPEDSTFCYEHTREETVFKLMKK